MRAFIGLMVVALILVAIPAFAGVGNIEGAERTQSVSAEELAAAQAALAEAKAQADAANVANAKLQGELSALQVAWQDANAEATAAQKRGDGVNHRRYRSRANSLAIQMSALSARVNGLESRVKFQEENPLGGTAESHRKVYQDLEQVGGFIRQEKADQRYVLRSDQPAVPVVAQPPAAPANAEPGPPANTESGQEQAPAGGSNMETIAWVGTIGILAFLVAWLIWSQVLRGLVVTWGEGWRTRLEERARDGAVGVAPAATADRTPNAAEAADWRRNASGLPDVEEPDYYRVRGGNGPGGSWQTYEAGYGETPAPRRGRASATSAAATPVAGGGAVPVAPVAAQQPNIVINNYDNWNMAGQPTRRETDDRRGTTDRTRGGGTDDRRRGGDRTADAAGG